MKNIIICCDGTWNTPDEKDGGVPTPTNVVRIYNAVAESSDDIQQHKYYHPGVGTDGSLLDKAIGGGTGRGLDQNIMSAYRALCDYYEDGDRIFLFGFSRGAYTVRSLVGLIKHCGMLMTGNLDEAEAWKRIEHVFQNGYRRHRETMSDWLELGWAFHGQPDEGIPIHFLGVWDTVGALGIPDDLALLNLIDNLHDYTFHDTSLSPDIKTARHAIAIDEMRASFQPTLWTPADGQDAKQRWFPGVHSDVGGGYRETGLSDGALTWMIEEARQCGLNFNPAMLEQIKPDYRGVLHDSCDGAFALLPTQPRSVPQLDSELPQGIIDKSASLRMAGPPIHQSPYRKQRTLKSGTPIVLDIFARNLWNETGLWLEAGTTYKFSASGEWMDASIKCGPGGTNDGHFQAAELSQMAGTALGHLETWFKKLSGNRAADFRFTKRHEDMPWFTLVGAIANGSGVDAKGRLTPHETFEIAKNPTYTPRKSGYFFAYANDAWNCYRNNRGSVQLEVS